MLIQKTNYTQLLQEHGHFKIVPMKKQFCLTITILLVLNLTGQFKTTSTDTSQTNNRGNFVYIDGQKVFPTPGRIFTGSSSNKSYKCWLKIYEDSTVAFVYQNNRKYDFGEFHGTVRKIDDTTFHASCIMTLGQGINKMLSDTPNIAISKSALKFDTLKVSYRKGKTKMFLIQDTTRFIALSTPKYGNYNYKTNDSLTLTINRKNVITNEPLKFIIPFGSSAEFIADEREEFDIIIKNNKIKTVGKPPSQTGHFNLSIKK